MSSDSPAPDPQSSPTPQTAPTSPAKPPRSPVERIIVWGVILAGAGIAAYEARAQFGYNGTIAKLDAQVSEEGGEDFKALTLGEIKKFASGGPAYSAISPLGTSRQNVTLTWGSLFKTYEITLTLTDDDEPIFLTYETAEPPEPPPPAVVESSDDGTDELPGGPGGGPGDFGGGGGAPAEHDADGSGRPQRPGGAGGPPPEGAGGPGAGGGGRGRARGLIGLLQADDVIAELNVTDEQAEKIAALQEQLAADAPDFRSIFSQLQGASEEEQATIRADMQKARDEMTAKTKEGLGGILDEGQMTRLQQIDWQGQGARALASADVTGRLNLSDEQKTKLTELNDQFQLARRELGFQASREERAQLDEEYAGKFAGVLTDEQTQAWQALQGESFERAAE